jgi:branched-chain amino acid transport system ATP-binding protein
MTGNGDESTKPAALAVTGLYAGYGAMSVVNDVAVSATPGRVTSIVGRNGAGKTTMLSAIAGLRYNRTRGSVLLNGTEISSKSPREIVQAGLALVPEGHPVFAELTVLENIRVGAFIHRRDKALVESLLDQVMTLFPALKAASGKLAGSLSGGQQQMLAISQALMSKPAVLLLDEPSAGLAPAVTDSIYDSIVAVAATDRAVVLVEQNVDRALEASHYTYVLDRGAVVLEGSSAELARSDQVAEVIRGVSDPLTPGVDDDREQSLLTSEHRLERK